MGLAGSRQPNNFRNRVYTVTDAAVVKMRRLVKDTSHHGDQTLKHFIDEAVEKARSSDLCDTEQWQEKDHAWGIVTNILVEISEWLYGAAWTSHNGRLWALLRKPEHNDQEVIVTLIDGQEREEAITTGRWRPMEYEFPTDNERPKLQLPSGLFGREEEKETEPMTETMTESYIITHENQDTNNVKTIVAATSDVEGMVRELVHDGVRAATIEVWKKVPIMVKLQVSVTIEAEADGGES